MSAPTQCWLRRTLVLALAGGMSGCTLAYDLRATVVDGRLAFRPESGDECASGIAVYDVEKLRQVSAPGTLSIQDATMWSARIAHSRGCSNRFPIVYGEAWPEANSGEARPLTVGVIYKVDADGDRFGSGCFRIEADRRIRNLPQYRCDSR